MEDCKSFVIAGFIQITWQILKNETHVCFKNKRIGLL